MAKREKIENPLIPLGTEQVNVTTMSVTIKALTIGKKQVTQSVFRQMPQAEMVDTAEVRLLGIPWGWINYHWGDINANWTHFVFQKGDKLYRCPFLVEDSPWKYYEKGCSEFIYTDGIEMLRERYRCECIAAFCATIVQGWRPKEPSNRYSDRWDLDFRCDPLGSFGCSWKDEVAHLRGLKGQYSEGTYTLDLSYLFKEKISEDCSEDKRNEYISYYGESGALTRIQEFIERNKKSNAKTENDRNSVLSALKKEIAYRVGSLLTYEQIKERMAEIERQAIDFNKRWDALMEQLRGVEQLFIAV